MEREDLIVEVLRVASLRIEKVLMSFSHETVEVLKSFKHKKYKFQARETHLKVSYLFLSLNF